METNSTRIELILILKPVKACRKSKQKPSRILFLTHNLIKYTHYQGKCFIPLLLTLVKLICIKSVLFSDVVPTFTGSSVLIIRMLCLSTCPTFSVELKGKHFVVREIIEDKFCTFLNGVVNVGPVDSFISEIFGKFWPSRWVSIVKTA